MTRPTANRKRTRAARREGAGDVVSWSVLLPDKRTLFIQIPAEETHREPDGSVSFLPGAVRRIDALRALAVDSARLTPGYIAALRSALGLTQAEFGRSVKADRMTVYRWERGLLRPGPEKVHAIRRLRRRAAMAGVTVG